uniref:Sushi, von Willebrand factor type A, EGF and pentraxin domain-containing protein 1-like n=1 Tax=Saccoglossus kowalevskii TaxID=10224 RepID=A0ABM0M9B6_SACKO|nr:PREDICTED: sushi, von Willebrand factor type A, EGF and pentraxin domain-containing protein 1-like [Saccoglossus kowalevskii]
MWLYLAMFAFHCHFVNANDILNSPLSKEYPQGKSDLVFLLDRSASVGSANFEAEKGFVESLLGQFSISPASTRVDVVSYSEDVVRHIDYIREPKNKCHFSQDIRHVTYRNSGKTNTNGALQEARNIFVGSRQDVHKVVVLLSDGQSNTGGDPTTTAEELRQDGVEIFTIAIGLFNKDELNSIATSDHHTFEYSSFREFKKLASRIRGDAHEVKWDATVSLDMCNNLCAHPSMSFGCCDIDAKCTCALIGGLHDCVCGPGYYGNAGLIGQCSGKSCPKLRAPSHGKISPTVCDNVFNAVCEFSCDDGYELITDQSKSRRCLTTGEWSSSQAVCQKRQCQSLPRPTNGDKQCKNGNDNEFGTVCTFSCNPGYVLSGSIHRKCTENGQWSGTDTSCQGLTCPALRAPDNGRIYPKSCTQKKQKVKRICILQCNDGYTLNGPQLQACTIEGEWSDDGIETTCIDDAPPDIECPASITTESDPGLPSALVHWSTPVVFDNSGKEPVLTVEPAGLKSPHRFTIGSTIITTQQPMQRADTNHADSRLLYKVREPK